MTTPKSTAFALSLIGATTSFVSGFFAPLVRVLEANWGFRRTILLGICLVSGGLIASGWAHQVWHLYLSQSLCFGLGYSIFFLVISKTVPEWFSHRRTTAMGIVMSSGGLGGLTFPFVITPLNETLGVSWTFRILGAAFLGINLLASFLVKPKPQKSLPSTTTLASVPSIKSFSSMIRFKLLKANVNLSLWCIAAFLQVVYMNIPLYFLPSYATQLGLSTTQGSSLVSITAGATFIGRLAVGALADRIGNMNACMIFSVISGAACFCIWTVAYDYATLIGFAVVFGLFGGSYLTTMPPIVQSIVPEQFPEGLALVTFVTSPAYAGPSVASSLENISQWEPFLVYKVFCGSVCIASALLILALKIRIHGRHLLAKV
ncbi:hypothetical protein O0I10_003965 [Lichtheimia ornata]|uniref:Major facilitator superfamily (MFS) profile domain-containing protein n=1 Tax=Lichtheimia ornata TaxID=688661 RepID=A0AAD7V7W3_9FUNG|nr:uncharacterized protein O0I10_003965 [Lichtheimia ornata]KAJ8660106.1 hypothetical protein O0I10_003965 [Lichtheimia ornata]